MRELWRRLRKTILEYQIEQLRKKVERKKAALLGLQLASFSNEAQVKRVTEELRKLRDDFDAEIEEVTIRREFMN